MRHMHACVLESLQFTNLPVSFNLTAALQCKAHLSPGEVTINDASGIEPILKHLGQVLQHFTKASFAMTRVQGSDPESSAGDSMKVNTIWPWVRTVLLHIYWLGNGEQLEASLRMMWGCRRG